MYAVLTTTSGNASKFDMGVAFFVSGCLAVAANFDGPVRIVLASRSRIVATAFLMTIDVPMYLSDGGRSAGAAALEP